MAHEFTPEAGFNIYMCDGCCVTQIVDARYGSLTYPDKGVCHACFVSGHFTDKLGPFKKQVVHSEAVCDGCKTFPIIGARYSALRVANFDLCETCEASEKWEALEPFVKIRHPSRGMPATPSAPTQMEVLVRPHPVFSLI
ncbi:Zz-type zinc finger-containing protein, partial [Globisporangium splendens]